MVNLTINGVNDPPSSISSSDGLSFSENLSIGSAIGSFVAVDPDAGDSLNFSLYDENQSTDNQFFSMDNNGTLRNAVLFDYESNASTYLIRVRVTDSASSVLDALFNLTLTDENEAPVIFSDGGVRSISSNEDESLSDSLTASDPDAGDSFTWSIQTDPSSGTATIDADGLLQYQPSTNFNGSDSLIINATDLSGLSDSVEVQLSILAVNDAPSFDLGDDPVQNSSAEDTPFSMELNVTDPDIGDTHTFSTSLEPTNGTLQLDSTNGILVYSPNLNFNGSDSFEITVTDSAGTSDSILFHLSVTAVNDSPVIDSIEGPLSFTILEDTTLSYDLNGSDPDLSDSLLWSVSGVPQNGTASIDPSTGVFQYQPNLDFNGSDIFSLSLSDGALQDDLEIQLSITGVNDPPSGISPAPDLNFTENLPVGSVLSFLSALDPDPDDLHSFVLLQAEETSTDPSFFILESNGTLRTATSFDFESNASQYELQVQATDLSGSSVVSTLILNLTNLIEDIDGDSIEDAYDPDIDGDGYTNEQEIAYGSDPYDPLSMLNRAPTFSGSTSFTVGENNQSAVFLLPASDLDTDDILSFSISGPDAATFSVNSATGEISFLQAPDFEANGSVAGDNLYLLSIHVSDGEDSTTSSISIQVLDIYEPPPNDPPTDLLLSGSIIEENLAPGFIIGQFSTVDPDDPESIHSYLYELVPNEGSGPSSNFILDENGTLSSAISFDFEAQSVHTITVRTTDHYEASFEKSFSISISDAFHSIVQTGSSAEITPSTAILSGSIIDQGGSAGVFRSGILLSTMPEPVLGGTGSFDFPSDGNAGDFSISASGLLSGTRYYYRAYSENPEGVSYGASEIFQTIEVEGSPSWASATPEPEVPNWWSSPWLGSFYKSDDSGWILHSKLGWLFVLPNADSGVWFWLEDRGWFWTDAGLYPFLFDHLSHSWVYFHGGDQTRLLLYNYNLGRWLTIDRKDTTNQ